MFICKYIRLKTLNSYSILKLEMINYYLCVAISYMLLDNFSEVANNPDLRKNYSGLTKNLLGFRAGRHIIFYRKMEKNEIEITRILHEQMDLKNRIKEK